MAIVSAKASSFTSTPHWKYHVFLSFRGEDTRKSFCDHLYAALKRKGILTFRDDEQLGRGEVISQELVRAIEGSLFSIVILSQNYASSTWCLIELQKIIDSTKVLGRVVLPVFYGVDPSEVRHQRGSFAKAFKGHEEKFKNNHEMVQKWRDALTEIANISGWNSQQWHEAELVQNIAEAVWMKLRVKLPPYFDNLVGIDSKIEDINKLLKMGMDDVRFVGIWGMGGIGKTTIARVVYERIRNEFEISFFLDDVRETTERNGLFHLQEALLSCLKIDLKIHNKFDGMKMIRDIFCNKKVLLILDDVSNGSQLENLAVNKDWFGWGSRVIITTRDLQLLTTQEVCEKYQVQILNEDESLQLFCQKVFNKGQPNEVFLKLSNSVVKYAWGLPLALKVLGSFLCKRSLSEWQDTLDKLKQNQPKDIFKVLKISYDGLEDEELKTIFLDIACFFNRESESKIIQTLASCGLHPTIGVQVLIEKSLLSNVQGTIYMHDMLQEMGKNIVIQESPNDPSKRSRLWSLEQIDLVLRGNKGAEGVQAIVLKLQESYEASWHPNCFAKMCNLRLLEVSNVHPLNGLKSLPSALKVLRWERYPLKSLPNNLKLDELVDLEMCKSKIRQLWNGTQVFVKLRFINLSYCKAIIKTPDVTGIPNLESLFLASCIHIVEVHPSLGQHKKLVEVNLSNCKSLEILPSKLEMNSLEILILYGCRKLKKLPEFGFHMKRLNTLDLMATAIVKLPESLNFLSGLTTLNLRGCQNLVTLPSKMKMNSLEWLILSGCTKFKKLPEFGECMKRLRIIYLEETAIVNLPPSIGLLVGLAMLILKGCKNLKCLPCTIGSLKHLNVLDISDCSKFSMLPDSFHEDMDLKELNVSRTAINEIPSSISLLKQLKVLSFRGCKGLAFNSRSLQDFPFGKKFGLRSILISMELVDLDLSYCNLCDESVPKDLSCLPSLKHLNLSGNNFFNLPSDCISNLLMLTELLLGCCSNLQSMPRLPPNLILVQANNCPSMIPSLDPQQIWDLFVSILFQNRHLPHIKGVNDADSLHVLLISGNEIPSWFHQQQFSFVDWQGKDFDSAITITANVPDSYRSSEWSGIAVCLVLEEPIHMPLNNTSIGWTFTSPEDTWSHGKGMSLQLEFDEPQPQLFIGFFPFRYYNCWRHLANGCRQLQLTIFVAAYVGAMINRRDKVPLIKRCAWRLLCKEDLQTWPNTMNCEWNNVGNSVGIAKFAFLRF